MSGIEASTSGNSRPKRPREDGLVISRCPKKKKKSDAVDTCSDTVDTIELKNKIDKFQAPLRNYYKGAGYIPPNYVVTPAYVKLKSVKFEELIKPRVVVYGPKGVGKSLSLLTLAVEMTNGKDKVLYFSPFSLDLPVDIIKLYLENCGFTGELDKLCSEIVNQPTKVTLLLDFGKGEYPGDNECIITQFKSIIRGNYDHIQVIVALSSGRGGVFNNNQFIKNLMASAKKIQFINFSDREALAFCKSFDGMEDKYPFLSKLSNNNPGLLDSFKFFCSLTDWKQEVIADAQLHIHDIITATFPSLLQMEKRKFVQKACMLTPYFLKCAVNGDRLPEKYKHTFLLSYVYLEGICYIDDTVEESCASAEESRDSVEESRDTDEESDTVEEEYFHIYLTFPGSEQAILDEVRSCMDMDVTSEEHKIAQILGYKFQLQFFKAFCKLVDFKIDYRKPGSLTGCKLCISNLSCFEQLENIVVNSLSSLRASHPAIDYVGVFNDFILFFQVSLSCYVNHESKFNDINRTYPKTDEFASKTILQYYRDYFKKSKVIFVYVSPKEKDIPKSLTKHAIKAHINEVYLGFIECEENSVLTQLMLNYKEY